MSSETDGTFRYDGDSLPVTDDVVLTAVGLLDRYHDDVEHVRILHRDEFLLAYDGRTARLSAIELISLAHTHYHERWTDAIETLDLDPVDASSLLDRG